MKIHKISAEHLSIERIGEIVYGGYQIQLSYDAQKRIVECRKVSRPEDRGDNFAHLWRYYRIRIALQREHRSGLSGTVADKPYDVARLRYGRPCAQRHCEDNAAAKDSVAELRFLRAVSLLLSTGSSTSSTTMSIRWCTCKARSELRATWCRWLISRCRS